MVQVLSDFIRQQAEAEQDKKDCPAGCTGHEDKCKECKERENENT
jgi:hypothetical protein